MCLQCTFPELNIQLHLAMISKILTLSLCLCGFLTVETKSLTATDSRYVQQVRASIQKIVRAYVELETEKLEQLIKHVEELDNRSGLENPSEMNPMVIYLKAKKLQKEWNNLYTIMSRTALSGLLSQNLTIPKPEHLKDMADAIFRLQDVYQFDAIQIATGQIPQMLQNDTLSAKTCRDLGLIAFEKNDHYHSLVWFQAALYRLQEENSPSMAIENIYPLLALSMDKKNNSQRARQVAQLFQENTKEDKVQEMVKKYPDFKRLLEETEEKELIGDLPQMVNDRLDWYENMQQPKYEMMCRQEARREAPLTSTLTCYYDHTYPYLLLAPSKVEIIGSDPFVAIYRQVISDQEIEVIRVLAEDRMRPSAIGVTTAWLPNNHHPIVARVRNRVAALTKLDFRFAEDLQVTKYGLGGHYRPHYDAVKSNNSDVGMKNASNFLARIATFMFYLSVPDLGGATIFPFADLIVTPSKNDALFWYNLHRDGNNDDHTLHAGCPVISGSKWVANQWIKLGGQEFTRPCALTEDTRQNSVGSCSC